MNTLFPEDDAAAKRKEINDTFLQNQLIKLGDMMGDGLHHEADGKWIEREYRKVTKQLMPEVYAEQRKKKRDSVDIQMAKLLEEKRCACGGKMRQVRKGVKACECTVCGNKYKAVKAKKK